MPVEKIRNFSMWLCKCEGIARDSRERLIMLMCVLW